MPASMATVPFAACSVSVCAAVKSLLSRGVTLTSATVSTRNGQLVVKFLRSRRRKLVDGRGSCPATINLETSFRVSYL